MKIFYFLSDKDLVFLVNNNFKKKRYLVALLKMEAGKFYLMKKLEKNLFNVFNMH
jgi:hypothetical protein